MSLCSQATIEWSNLFSSFLLFCIQGSQKKLFSHLKCVYGRGIILHFRFLRHDTISVLNTSSHEALINFSACYFGNFSFCQHSECFFFCFSFYIQHFIGLETLFMRSTYLFLKNIRNKIWRNECVLYLLLKDSRDMGWQRKVQFCVLRRNGPRLLRWRRPDHRGIVAAALLTPATFRSRPKLNYKANSREETFWNATENFFFYGRFFLSTKFTSKQLQNTNFSLITCERGKLDPKKISKMLIWCYRRFLWEIFSEK